MGAWGTGILENDSTVDHLIAITTLWNLNLDKLQIQRIMLKRYLEDEEDALSYDIDRYSQFWTAIAFAEWLYDKPSKEVVKKIEKIINSGQVFHSWDQPDQRMSSITDFFKFMQVPRIKNENRAWEIWFWENTEKITDNQFAETISMRYNTLERLGIKISDRIEILKRKYEPLTVDFEEAIFWAAILKSMNELDEVNGYVSEQVERVVQNPESMNVIKVAYNEEHRNRILDSLRMMKNKKRFP